MVQIEFLLHALLKARGLLPEEPLPCGEVGALEQCVLKNALHTSQGLDDICPVVVQVPQLAIMALVGPPEGVLLQHLVLLEVRAHTPALVVGQGVTILLEQGVDPGDTSIPGVLQVLYEQALQGMTSERNFEMLTCIKAHTIASADRMPGNSLCDVTQTKLVVYCMCTIHARTIQRRSMQARAAPQV